MVIGPFVLLVALVLIGAVLFNPVIWFRIALAMAPEGKRPELIAELRRLALQQPAEQAVLIVWLIDRAVGKGDADDGNAGTLSAASVEQSRGGGVQPPGIDDDHGQINAGDPAGIYPGATGERDADP